MSACDGTGAARALLIENAALALPDGVAEPGSLLVVDGRIAAVGAGLPAPAGAARLDAGGLLLAPGFVDLHSDAIEKEIRPRPGGSFPLGVALTELDKRLAACGVTTMYHCLCFGESETNELRTARRAGEIAAALREMAPSLTVRNRIHVRFEIVDVESVPTLLDLLDRRAVELFSFMDHTPGQGQFADIEHFKTYYSQAEHLTGDQAVQLAAARVAARGRLGDGHLRELAAVCRARGIPMASHDDDTEAKVEWVHDLGVSVSEFPVSLRAARRATELGMHVLMGAPNVLRGGSLTGNLSGQEAIRAGACAALGSDYAPMSLLHAVFALAGHGLLPLHRSLELVTLNPARAAGLAGVGALREGFVADLVLIDWRAPVPRLVKTFVGGREVFSAPSRVAPAQPAEEKSLDRRDCRCAALL